jgi:hypothetical protein
MYDQFVREEQVINKEYISKRIREICKTFVNMDLTRCHRSKMMVKKMLLLEKLLQFEIRVNLMYNLETVVLPQQLHI